MKRKALFMSLSSKVKDDELTMLDKLDLAAAKTKQMLAVLNDLQNVLKKDFQKGTLVVLPASDETIVRASRNLPKIKIARADSLNILDILKYKYLLLLKGSEKVIEKIYLPKTQEE